MYKVADSRGAQYALKYFHSGIPRYDLGRSKANHYGRRRDGSALVFKEIRRMCRRHHFLVGHLDRLPIGSSWGIIVEWLDGPMLGQFIIDNAEDNLVQVRQSIVSVSPSASGVGFHRRERLWL